MARKSLLAVIAVFLLALPARAQAVYGLDAYGAIDAGFLYAYESLTLGNGGDNATLAMDFADYALFFANYAYAFDSPDWYYWASYYSLVAMEFAQADYAATGSVDSLSAAEWFYDGALLAYDAFLYGG
jgi:hypothetical protein